MADPSAPVANRWTFYTTAFTSLIAALPVIAALVLGSAGTVGYQKLTKAPEPIRAADPPRPVPMVAIGDLENLLAPYGAKLDELAKRIDERYPKAPEPKAAPSKVRPIK